MSKQDIIDFGRRWDPLPMHIDEEAAASGVFGGLIASGVHTMAIFQRLNADRFLSTAAIVAGRGMEAMRLLQPVRPGDVLHGTVEIREVELRDDGRAVVRTRGRLTNGTGAVVFEVLGELLWLRRPRSATGAAAA